MATTMTSKGQVTIPKAVRDLLDLGPGSKVEFRYSDGNVVLERADHKKPVSRFAELLGHAGPGMTTDEVMELTRGES